VLGLLAILPIQVDNELATSLVFTRIDVFDVVLPGPQWWGPFGGSWRRRRRWVATVLS
jgi:hypothetical protein